MSARTLALAPLFALSCLLLSLPAAARGVRAEQARLEEDKESHSWKLRLVVDYGAPPDRDVVPMTFSFRQTASYERALTDQSPDKPVMQIVPLGNQVPNESVQEIGFSDGGTGKRFAVTKMKMTLRRKDDFEAGEYELTVKLENGSKLGMVRIQLAGDNKPVDRRSLVFHADVGRKKKAASKAAGGDGDKPASGAAEDQGPDLSNIPDAPAGSGSPSRGSAEPNGPPPLPPKQGGCGCRLAAQTDPSVSLMALFLFLSAILIRRRHEN